MGTTGGCFWSGPDPKGRGGGGGSMDPSMVAWNNVLCRCHRRQRFCFRHPVRVNFSFHHMC